MLGLELSIKDKTIAAGVEKGVASIIITQMRKEENDAIELDFKGLDLANNQAGDSITWHTANLKEGDELVIRVKKLTQISEPEETRSRDAEQDNQRKVNAFLSMKQELEAAGLI